MAWRYHVQVPPPVDRKGKTIDQYTAVSGWWHCMVVDGWEWVGVGGGGTTDAMMVIKELIGDTKLENENSIF